MDEGHQVTLFTRRPCHLCDVARATIEAVRRRHPFELTEVDIDTDDGLVRDHGYRVPVVAVDGIEVFEIEVDGAELAAIVASPGPGGRR